MSNQNNRTLITTSPFAHHEQRMYRESEVVRMQQILQTRTRSLQKTEHKYRTMRVIAIMFAIINLAMVIGGVV